MNWRLLIFLALAATPAGAATPPANVDALPPEPPPATVSLPAEQITAYRNYLEKARLRAGVPGLAVVIVQPGKTLLIESLGQKSMAADAKVTTDTRFALGPTTEALNSLLLETLAAQKTLDLDAPVRRSWDEFKLNDADATKAATLRQLLGMTVGLPERIDNPLGGDAATPADLFALLSQTPIAARPGQEFAYCDTSAATAGYLAVYAANQRHAPANGLPTAYAALVKQQIFDPLGMTGATFDPPAPDGDDATGHIHNDQGTWQPTATPAKTGEALRPARGARLSAHDVAAWLQCELSGGLKPDGSRLLSEAALQERWRPTGQPERDFGLGWAVQHYHGVELVARLSEQNDQASLVMLLPQYRTALAVLTNACGHDAVVFLQDALLNFADLAHEAATPP